MFFLFILISVLIMLECLAKKFIRFIIIYCIKKDSLNTYKNIWLITENTAYFGIQ
jgi:hypothetical protein